MKPMRKIQLTMCSAGLVMGTLFPFYAGQFVEWIPAKRAHFALGCLAAGYIVGLMGYFVVRRVLMGIDEYYRQQLREKLAITAQRTRSDDGGDLLLTMQSNFEELLDDYASVIRRESERLMALTITDPLTSLYNQRHFRECFGDGPTGSTGVSVLFCDIDYFKSINDSYGHQVGDRVLQNVAQIIREVVGDRGQAFRYGGEEFVVWLENCCPESTLDVAEKIRRRVEAAKNWIPECPACSVTISIGIAQYPNHGVCAYDLVLKADKAMYQAKQNGRNQCRVYQSAQEVLAS